ncbi:50S ribosomal protein L19 [Candidatus Microgenomates bacterium]|nr:MAG: 50S ribosomal protein L19 [Candidatus Microgenomates bacterium]
MAIAITHGETTFSVGDTVGVHYKIVEKDVVAGKTKKEKKEEVKERIQVFEGIVLAIRGEGNNKNFVVRRIGADSVGIERIFPIMSPWIAKVTVKRKGDNRRAKLYYLRNKTKKEISKIAVKAAQKEKAAASSAQKSTPANVPAQSA